MALWDTADLVERCVLQRRRPTSDAGTTTANWYSLLTAAESHWKPVIAAHYPKAMIGSPTLMTSADGGLTYDFPSSELAPLWFEITESPTGFRLKPGVYDDRTSDYVVESGRIRMTAGRPRTFADGPYIRMITSPAALDASTDSTIFPKHLRLLLVYRACELDASRGGMDDPAFYRKLLSDTAFGDPAIPGDVGLLGALKNSDSMGGQAAYAGRNSYRWWRPNG